MEEFERTCDDTDAPVTLRRSRPPSRDVEISLEEEGSPGGSRTRRMWGLARRLLKRWRVSRSRSESPEVGPAAAEVEKAAVVDARPNDTSVGGDA